MFFVLVFGAFVMICKKKNKNKINSHYPTIVCCFPNNPAFMADNGNYSYYLAIIIGKNLYNCRAIIRKCVLFTSRQKATCFNFITEK